MLVKFIHRNPTGKSSNEDAFNALFDALGIMEYRFDDLPLLLEKCNLSMRKFCELTGRHKNIVKNWMEGKIPAEIKEDVLSVIYSKADNLYLLKAGKTFIDTTTGKKLRYDEENGKFYGYSAGMSKVIEQQLKPNIRPIFEDDILTSV